MPHHTVADELVERLIRAGVKRMYGVVGDSLNPVTDAVRRRSDRIRWIHVRHEETGAFAAGAEAQLSEQLTVCAGSCGPGHVHLINGLYDAHRSLAPVVAIASHIPSHEIGTDFFQETHPERLFEECSHYCELVSNARQLPRMLQIAMQTSVGTGGVSVLALPGDIAGQDMPDGVESHAVVRDRPHVRPCDDDIERFAEMLNDADRVTIFAGFGCRHAHDDVVELAGALNAPVGFAYRGKQFLDYDNPFNVGMSGLLGFGAAYRAMHECDLLVLLGTDFPYEQFLPSKPKIAQVDIRVNHLGRRCKIDLGLWGDVGETIRAVSPRVKRKTSRSHLDSMLKEHRGAMEKLGVYVEHVGRHRPIHPEHVAATLDELAADDAVFTVDTGMCNVWHARYIRATRNRRMLASYLHGSMANALPQAIGAQLLYPDRQVISMSGDGGFAMLMGDILTVLQYDLPIKIVLFNNSALGMVKLEMEVAGMPDWQTDLKNPNFAKMAEAIGFMGVRVEDPADVRDALRSALDHRGPALIDVVTDANALSMPPHVNIGQMEGFSLAMGKLMLSGHVDEVVDTIRANLRHI
jgi:pyruvate dehydrogenase (quinone)